MKFRSITPAELGACDAVVVAVGAGGSLPARLPRSLHTRAQLVIAAGGLGRLFSVATQYGANPERLVLVSSGKSADATYDRLRKIASAGVRSLVRSKAKRIAIVIDAAATAGVGADLAVTATVDGAIYARWRPGAHRTKPEALAPIGTVGILAEQVTTRAIRRGEALGDAVNRARTLAHAPANLMTPTRMAEEARAIAKVGGLGCEVLDEAACRKLGMHAYLAIAQGSAQPPRFIVLRHAGRAGKGVDLALVGKGITFDSGGISIKQPDSMHNAKADMTGAAAVLAGMGAIARLGVKANVIGIAACTENLPGGSAVKPGDVVTSMSGKTIEILNTDAEGRVILIDALAYAQRQGARLVVDIATLTGAINAALGEHLLGLLGRPDEFLASIREMGAAWGDRFWVMPLDDDFRDAMRSDIADLRNVGTGRGGGASKAAAFLEGGVEPGTEWAHIDLGFQDTVEREQPWSPRGPQGAAIRTFVALAEASAPD